MYSLLRRGSSSSLEDIPSAVHENSSRTSYDRLLLWTCIVVATSSILSSFLLLSNERTHTTSLTQGGLLRRPNPYINLDRLYKVDPPAAREPFPSIYSFAHVVLQFSPSDPHRRFMPEDDRSYSSREGYIYTDDRHVLVTPKISTVIQFRNQDYGMENCTLEPTIPDATNSPADLDSSVHIDHTSVVEIWMLDNTREISRYDPVSWTAGLAREKASLPMSDKLFQYL
ncbi:hypothetical protein VKT23_017812 [Stygiomarasmius scandens]|uniref:Ubiquitin 3 binding protein But2 C-terminal domain-containing protein n=1 Tax=Marasmiellus scandens TaxID=2682957 RepID=A0ABR1ISI8_9AGAR